MSQTQEAAADGKMITLAAASRIVGVHPTTLKSIALSGAIKVRSLPGARTLYAAADAYRLAGQSQVSMAN